MNRDTKQSVSLPLRIIVSYIFIAPGSVGPFSVWTNRHTIAITSFLCDAFESDRDVWPPEDFGLGYVSGQLSLFLAALDPCSAA